MLTGRPATDAWFILITPRKIQLAHFSLHLLIAVYPLFMRNRRGEAALTMHVIVTRVLLQLFFFFFLPAMTFDENAIRTHARPGEIASLMKILVFKRGFIVSFTGNFACYYDVSNR